MSKPASDAPIRLPSAQQVKALLKEGSRVKEKMSEIAGTYGDRVKSAIENGNLHGAAFGKAKSIYTKGRTNELAALEQMYHLRVYLDWIEEDIKNKGHVGNIDDLAKQAAADEPAPETAPGGVPLADAQKMFEGTKAIADNRKAAAKKLDIPALDPDAPAAADPVEKPKRGRSKKADAAPESPAAATAAKYVADQEKRLGKVVDTPPAPPAAVPTLADDDDDDIRPGFLKAKDAERKAAAVH